MRLFTPGPTYVREEILAEMARPPIDHRRGEMHELLSAILPGLRRVFGAGEDDRLFAVTSSATGLMEAAVTSAVARGGKILNLICGHFGERWRDISRALGREAFPLRVEWGGGISAGQVERALKERRYDALTLTHNETSTGVLNPLEEIARAVRETEGVLFFVDAVSSLGGAAVDVERNGIDFCFAGTQKCLALPPGLAVACVSARCLKRARRNPDRGYYFDLTKYAAAAEDFETAFTPSAAHLFALKRQLEDIERETVTARYARHRAMGDLLRAWAEGPGLKRRGFSILAEPEYRSPAVTAIKVPDGFDVHGFLCSMRGRGFLLGAGAGKLREETFRIGHMGDLTLGDVADLTEALSDCLEGF
ncbi:MAG: pyridoxal-phosphate-dependent aminotransferase family protein [Nitrospinota bacterium]